MKKFDVNFKLVLVSQIISLIGGNVLRFALLLFILDMSGSAGTFGLVMAVSQIPVFLFAIPGGIIADRMDKKKLIVFFDGIKTVICAVLVGIFLTGTYSVMNLTVIIAVFMMILTLFTPILTAATPVIVKSEVLEEANGAIQGVNAISELLSFVLGGVLIATIGMMNIIILAAVAFLISTVIDLFIKIAHQKTVAEFGVIKTAVTDMKASLTYATKKNPLIIKLSVAMGFFAFLIMPVVTVALPYIVRIQFAANDTMFGVAQAVSALGMLLGGVLAGKFKKWLEIKNFGKLVMVAAVFSGLLALTVHAPFFGDNTIIPFWLFNIVLMLLMVIMTFGSIVAMSFVQKQVPEKYLGKTVALMITILNVSIPVSQYFFGQMMELLTGRTSLLFIGIGGLMFGLATVGNRLFSFDVVETVNA
jgi:MFS family permease